MSTTFTLTGVVCALVGFILMLLGLALGAAGR